MAVNVRVYPNPWMGAVPLDVDGHADINEFVGAVRRARIDRPEEVQTFTGRRTGKVLEVVTVPGRQTTTIEYCGVPEDEARADGGIEKMLKSEPVLIPFTTYYRKRILRGELIAADEESARHAAVTFVEPAELLKHARAGVRHLNHKALAESLKATAPKPEPVTSGKK